MFSYLEILRIPNALMSIFAVLITAILIGFYNPLKILIACLAVFLISGGGMVINDYFDYTADKVNKPKRALPSGKISRKNALIYSLFLFLIGNILCLLLNFQMFLIALFNTLLLIAYSWKIKKIILLGNFVVSWLTASIFLFTNLLLEKITPTILILFLMAFSANIGREITKTIEDMEGDKKIKAKTLAIVGGKNLSAWAASIFIIFAVLFSPIPYFLNLLNINYLILVTFADIIFLYSCFAIFISPAKSQKMMKIAMFIALISFLIGVF
ncbi:MAG: UbiA family prenyltransferase [Candidatus Aenigmatarchaeota archaeon]